MFRRFYQKSNFATRGLLELEKKGFRKVKTMKKEIIALGAALMWAVGGSAATHEGVQLWENGPLWAKTNIGANSPTEMGYYFWWGDTLGYKWLNSKWVASDNSVSNFSFVGSNCPTYGKTLAQLQSMGAVGADGNLLPAYDAAAQQWGDDWRVPKASELRNLIDLCTWTWATNNNVAGYTVTGKGLYSGNSIFLPMAGQASSQSRGGLDENGYPKFGRQWSSSVCSGVGAFWGWNNTSRSVSSGSTDYRQLGFSIRPVKSMSAAKAASAAALDDTGLSASGYSAGAVGSLQLAAPTGVYATDGTSSMGVTVSWNATPGAAGKTYYYSVKAVSTSGESDFSAFVSGRR